MEVTGLGNIKFPTYLTTLIVGYVRGNHIVYHVIKIQTVS